jgi:hypothetical protein
MLRFLIPCLLATLSLTSIAYAGTTSIGVRGPADGLVCDKDYALCTSARCTPDPLHPELTAICDCDVERGPNYGFSSCEARLPQEKSGATMLLSTYSFVQTPTKNVMTCATDTYWTDCLDAPCTVDPRNPNKAICTCKIQQSAGFVTYGGRCNQDTCENHYWSGATPQAFDLGSAALMSVLDLTKDQKPFTYCPTD